MLCRRQHDHSPCLNPPPPLTASAQRPLPSALGSSGHLYPHSPETVTQCAWVLRASVPSQPRDRYPVRLGPQGTCTLLSWVPIPRCHGYPHTPLSWVPTYPVVMGAHIPRCDDGSVATKHRLPGGCSSRVAIDRFMWGRRPPSSSKQTPSLPASLVAVAAEEEAGPQLFGVGVLCRCWERVYSLAASDPYRVRGSYSLAASDPYRVRGSYTPRLYRDSSDRQ